MPEKIISFYGTTEDQLIDRIAEKLTERFQTFKSSTPIVDEMKPLSVDEAADFLGVAKQTIYNATSEGTIPFHKQGGKLWFFRDELIAWIKNGHHNAHKVHLRG